MKLEEEVLGTLRVTASVDGCLFRGLRKLWRFFAPGVLR